jgi:hypothetical protein
MAFLFRPGGPQVGATGAPALTAGVTALAGPGAAPAADISIVSDQARLMRRPERIAGGSASVTARGHGRAQRDGGGLRK